MAEVSVVALVRAVPVSRLAEAVLALEVGLAGLALVAQHWLKKKSPLG
jgi:hypothetical protein